MSQTDARNDEDVDVGWPLSHEEEPTPPFTAPAENSVPLSLALIEETHCNRGRLE
jgi:hypothetical protein